MKVGLISPIAHLNEFATGSFHLILLHLLEKKAYRDHYKKMAKAGAWIVLDNSAHEFGSGGDPSFLLRMAQGVGVSELVCPDVLFDAQGTIERGCEAMSLYKSLLDNGSIQSLPQLMIVPQASSIYEYGICLKRLMEYHSRLFGNRHFTIGVSKDYEVWNGGIINLIDRFIAPLSPSHLFDVHLLGWGRQLHQLTAINQRFPTLIRSTDSAKPFVYATQMEWLQLDRYSPEYPKRPENYFDIELTEDQLRCARHNVTIFRQRAGWTEEQR